MRLSLSATAWVGGLLLSFWWHPPPLPAALFALALGALALLLLVSRVAESRRRWQAAALPCLLVALLLLGLARGSWAKASSPPLSGENLPPSEPLIVEGRVVSDPELVGTSYRLTLETISVSPRPQEGPARRQGSKARLLVILAPSKSLTLLRHERHFRYGDVLRLQGRLEPPADFGLFDYRACLAQQGIFALMSFPQATLVKEGEGARPLLLLYALRSRLASSLQRALPEPQAALAQALLLGLRRDLPPEVRGDFIRTGTAHLLAISGLHVGVLLGVQIGAGTLLFGRRRWALLLPLFGIWLYALLSGLAPPMSRAAIMGSAYLWARWEGRSGAGLPSLGLAAAVLAGVNPALLQNVSFQLSFTAMAGLVLLAPPVETRLNEWTARWTGGRAPERLVRGVNMALAAGAAATVATLPLIAFYFHRLSLVGIPVTLLALPVLPLVLVTGSVTAIAGTVFEPLGQILGWISWAPLSYLLELVHFAALPKGVALDTAALSPAAVCGYYAALAILIAGRSGGQRLRRWLAAPALAQSSGQLRTPPRPAPPSDALAALSASLWRHLPKRSAALLLLVGGPLLWIAAFSAPDGLLHVTVLDVGQGDAIFLQSPSGRQMLVDGGPDPQRLLRGLGDHMPFWDRTLDVGVLTHPDYDHLGGLTASLRRYRLGLVLERLLPGGSARYLEWQQAVQERRVKSVAAQAGQKLRLGDGVLVEVLHPPERLLESTGADDNNNAVVLRVVYGGVSFLLASDVHRLAERYLLDSKVPLSATVLKVPHHGSRSSSSPAFIASVAPTVAVISAGSDNQFGHPHPETMETLTKLLPQERILLTSKRGSIEFTTDGHRLWVKTQR
ncbi:MAG: ComEC/Rec2 family competence protein [Chloroflexi bacterium]|nr:ComEC/Rec2 family competence protein [Chloroflexota bacterium]